MNKKKGFTLIELLAVIVILAIIALITIPLIMNVISNAKEGSARDSAYGYLESIDTWYAKKLLEDNNFKFNGTYTVDSTGKLGNYNLGVKGTTPKGGSLTFTSGKVSSGCLTISDYKVTITSGEVTSVEKGECEVVESDSCVQDDEGNCLSDRTYTSGDAITLADYNWHVISDDGGYLTLLMDAGQLGVWAHCTDDTDPDTDCGVSNGYAQYSWDKSLIRSYLNNEFLETLEEKIGNNTLISTKICPDPSISSSSEYSYGGYLKSEIESLGVSCNNGYVSDKVRLITVSEYYNLSPYYENNTLSLANGGQLAAIDSITRIEVPNPNWLYFTGPWWTMGAYSHSVNSAVELVSLVVNMGYLYTNEYADDTVPLRPVITIIK